MNWSETTNSLASLAQPSLLISPKVSNEQLTLPLSWDVTGTHLQPLSAHCLLEEQSYDLILSFSEIWLTMLTHHTCHKILSIELIINDLPKGNFTWCNDNSTGDLRLSLWQGNHHSPYLQDKPFALLYDLIKLQVVLTFKDWHSLVLVAPTLWCQSSHTADNLNIQAMINELSAPSNRTLVQFMLGLKPKRNFSPYSSITQSTKSLDMQSYLELIGSITECYRSALKQATAKPTNMHQANLAYEHQTKTKSSNLDFLQQVIAHVQQSLQHFARPNSTDHHLNLEQLQFLPLAESIAKLHEHLQVLLSFYYEAQKSSSISGLESTLLAKCRQAWAKGHELTLENEPLWVIKSIDKLFEYYCLLHLITMLYERGYDHLQERGARTYQYQLRALKHLEPSVEPNTFYFAKQAVEMTLYYQPIISGSYLENDLELFRTTQNQSLASAKLNHYNPDFVLKSTYENQSDYIIFDAKYSSERNIIQHYMPDMLEKYLNGIAVLDLKADSPLKENHNLVSFEQVANALSLQGSVRTKCPKMIYALQGRLNEAQSQLFASQSNPIWRHCQSPLAQLICPPTNIGLIELNYSTQGRHIIWDEMCKVLPYLRGN